MYIMYKRLTMTSSYLLCLAICPFKLQWYDETFFNPSYIFYYDSSPSNGKLLAERVSGIIM